MPREDTQPSIAVDSYQKAASIGGWAGAGRTLWAISAVGVVAGAAIGLVAPFIPVIVTAGTMGLGAALGAAASAVPASIAVFSATGLSMGMGSGLMLGRVSGSVATVAEEQEKRIKNWTAKQILAQNPNAEIVPDAPKPAPEKKSFWQRVKDTYRTYVNPPVGITMMAVGAIGGLIMAAAFAASGGLPAFAMVAAPLAKVDRKSVV